MWQGYQSPTRLDGTFFSYHIMTSYRVSITGQTTAKCYLFVKYNIELTYVSNPAPHRKRNRKQKIIWFNQPLNKALQTNIGRIFLQLLEKHFPPHHRLQ